MNQMLLTQEAAQEFLQDIHQICLGNDSIKARILMLRSLLEQLYKTLTKDAQVAAGNLFSKMQYIHDVVNMDSFMVAQANTMRIFCNKVSHENSYVPQENEYLSCVWVLVKLLELFHPQAADPHLIEYLQKQQAQAFSTRSSKAKRKSFLCAVKAFKLNSSPGLDIDAIDEEGNYISIRLFDDEDEQGRGGKKWSLLAKVLWPWATLNCINLNEAPSDNNRFFSNPGTLIVVEPDYLMDVTSIAECITTKELHPELAVIHRLVSEPSSSSMVLGTTVNNIFDDLVMEPEADYNELFKRSLARSPIPLVSLGANEALKIHSTIKEKHLPQLKAMAIFAKSHPLMLEPSYICPKYGLQGRLDLLYQKDGKYYIMELKSGVSPNYGLWPNHQAQVIGYNMLVRECYGNSLLGTASILYSSTKTKSLRFVSNTTIQEQDLLMCRNRILGIWKILGDEPRVFFDWLKAYPGDKLADFSKNTLQTIQTTLKQLDDHEYEWFLEQIRLAVKETWYVKIGSCGTIDSNQRGHNSLWRHSKEEKLQRYRLLPDLRLKDIDKNILTFQITKPELISNFREGDVVVVSKEELKIDKQQIIRAELIELGSDYLRVRSRGMVNPELIVTEDCSWALEHDLLESMLFGPLASIMSLASAPKAKRKKIIGLEEPAFEPLIQTTQDELDQMINNITAAKDYCVVQGPPGTGKTSGLLTRMIQKLYNETEQILIVLSFTNRAVDEICHNLSKNEIPYIRTGRSQSIKDRLLEKLIENQRFEQIEELIRQNRIWVATVPSCNIWIYDFLKILPNIGTLIIDEASQIIEANILGIISLAPRFFLIGDQNQLPPIVSQQNSNYSFSSPPLNSLCYSSYNRSMMERLFLLCQNKNWLQAKYMLHKHYRMHNSIASLISNYYHQQLSSGTPSQSSELIIEEGMPEYLKHRIVWVDCPATTEAFYDIVQAKAIHCLIHTLIQKERINNPAEDLGIVAPFRAMIQALKKELDSDLQDITIDTVERFQGSERKIIIMSLPLRDKADFKNLESISDDLSVDRKLNVALSRAKEMLYIFGNSKICAHNPHYAFLIDTISSSHKLISSEEIIN